MSALNEDPYEVAKEKGLECVLPADDELQIDIDDEASLKQYERGITVLSENGIIVTETKRTVSAGGNTHIYVKCELRASRNASFWKRMFGQGDKIDPMTRIALQACLGSDRVRELLSILRITSKSGRPPTVFFEKPAVTMVTPVNRQVHVEGT